MSRSAMPHDDRLRELLAERALGGLTAEEARELSSVQDTDRAELEFAEALVAVELAVGTNEPAPMPPALRQRLEAAADAFAQGRTPQPEAAPASPAPVTAGRIEPARRASPWFAAGGWIAAAACVAILIFSQIISAPTAPEGERITDGTPTGGLESAPLASQRRALLATAADVQTFEWHPWALEGEGPEIRQVTGDVVWSESRQEGFMRFRGLPANDPGELQYQLWIVDRRGLFDETGQSARISGGVFDASDAWRDPQTGDLIVPIRARLQVQGAAAFAVTIEEPGGTWVSTMNRRVVWTIPG